MTVAGIDLSSFAIDVVVLDETTTDAAWHRFKLDGPTPFQRARSLRTLFPTRSWWEDNGVYLIGIEDPHSRQSHTAKALGLAAGAVAALLPHDLTVIQTPPAEWKRLFTGRANANKADVAATVLNQYAGAAGWPDDATDAYGIAWAIRHLNNEAITRGAA